MLNRLPELWLVDFVLEWLIDSESWCLKQNNILLGKLDVAFCDSKQRNHWLELLCSEKFTVDTRFNSKDNFVGFLRWLSARNAKLQKLNIWFSSISDQIAQSLLRLNLSKVRTINQLGGSLSAKESMLDEDSLKQVFIQCINLTELDISASQLNFTSEVFQALTARQLKQIESLTLTENFCNADVLSEVIQNCQNLESLTVDRSLAELFTTSILIKCVAVFKRLSKLELCVPVSSQVLVAISECLPAIESLKIIQGPHHEDTNEFIECLFDVIRSSCHLDTCYYSSRKKHLYFSGDDEGALMSIDTSLPQFVPELFKVKHVFARTTEIVLLAAVDDSILNAISMAVPQLLSLDTVRTSRHYGNNSFTLAGLQTLLKSCQNLSSIETSGWDHLPMKEMMELLFSCGSLRNMSLTNVTLTVDAVNAALLKSTLNWVCVQKGEESRFWSFKRA